MKANSRCLGTLILVILLPISASSQGPGMNLAAMRAFWKPVVGAGAAYSLEQKDLGKIEMQIAVVGTETVAGKTGYWTEQTMKDSRHGEGRSKILFVGDRNTLPIKRMITQGPMARPLKFPLRCLKEAVERNRKNSISWVRKRSQHLRAASCVSTTGQKEKRAIAKMLKVREGHQTSKTSG